MADRDTAYKEHDIIYENGQIVVNESLNNKISETDYDTIVSGFDASDYTDHPAIEEGFKDANLIE